MTHKVLLLPGDGIGPEIAAQAARLLQACQEAGLDRQSLRNKACGY